MRIGIIDCGTNTFHLLIANILDNGTFNILHKLNIAVKLGEGGIDNNVIKENAYARGLNALRQFRALLQLHNVSNIKCYGTAALRNATNGQQFLIDAQSLGIHIQLIDGNREAELIYKGVSHSVNLPVAPVIIMDIGGGSTEFIICTNKEIVWKKSFELGAALLLEKFKPHDPIIISEVAKIEQHLNATLQPMLSFINDNHISITELIGSAGSFETFAEMCLHQFSNPEELTEKNSFDIPLQQYLTVHNQLLNSNAAERKQMKGLIEMRVDMIVIASILFMYVVKKIGIKKVTLSAYALKEGMLFEEN
ncbi:MAG: exopolyphosphatase [Bacteroidetes bacterium]|nr:exopolyphosphatase [Bacteroidota bacterium]